MTTSEAFDKAQELLSQMNTNPSKLSEVIELVLPITDELTAQHKQDMIQIMEQALKTGDYSYCKLLLIALTVRAYQAK